MKKLNISCGEDYKEGYINIDVTKNVRADVYINDIEELDYKDVDEILFYKTMPYVDDEIKVISKFYSMLKKGGKLKITVPHFTSPPYTAKAKRHIGYRVIEFLAWGEGGKAPKWRAILENKFKVKVRIILFKGFQFWNYLLESIINTNQRTQTAYEESFLRSLSPVKIMEIEMVKNKKEG